MPKNYFFYTFEELEAELKKVKTSDEARCIVHSLERRNASPHWIDTALHRYNEIYEKEQKEDYVEHRSGC